VTTARPGTTTARPATPAAAPKPRPFRATLTAITISTKRTSAKSTLSCPASAPVGCLVQLTAKVAGGKAIRPLIVALPKGTSSPVTVTLTGSTVKRLKTQGGSLQVTAKTALSTLGSATQTAKVKRPKAKKKAAKH